MTGMTITIQQLFLGQPKKIEDGKGIWYSAIFRDAVSGPVQLETRGFVGDQVADTKNHGSLDQAVCCHPRAHYDAWNAEYQLSGSAALVGGEVGENWTLSHVTEFDVCIGDIFQVGQARVQVSQPRYPCFKQERKTGLKGFLKRTGETLRTGWYMRVLQAGEVSPNDDLHLEARPNPAWTIQRVNEHLHKSTERELTPALLALPELSDGWKGIIKLVT